MALMSHLHHNINAGYKEETGKRSKFGMVVCGIIVGVFVYLFVNSALDLVDLENIKRSNLEKPLLSLFGAVFAAVVLMTPVFTYLEELMSKLIDPFVAKLKSSCVGRWILRPIRWIEGRIGVPIDLDVSGVVSVVLAVLCSSLVGALSTPISTSILLDL